MLAGLVEQRSNSLELRHRGLRRVVDREVELEPRGREYAAGFVVQRKRDPLGAVLESLVQSAQRVVRFVDEPPAHLERGQRLDEEQLGGADQLGGLGCGRAD